MRRKGRGEQGDHPHQRDSHTLERDSHSRRARQLGALGLFPRTSFFYERSRNGKPQYGSRATGSGKVFPFFVCGDECCWPVRLHVRYCHSTNRVVGYEGFQHRKFNWDLPGTSEPAQTFAFLGKWEYGDYFVMDHHAAEDIYHLRENLDFFQTPLDAALRVVEMRGDYQLPTGWRWDSECGPVPPPSPLPTPPPLPPPPRVVAEFRLLATIFTRGFALITIDIAKAKSQSRTEGAKR